MMDEMETPEHVAKMASGGHMCKSCGGAVGADGYAEGGMVDGEDGLTDEDGDREMRPKEVGDESSQMVDTERMREFAMAMKKGKR